MKTLIQIVQVRRVPNGAKKWGRTVITEKSAKNLAIFVKVMTSCFLSSESFCFILTLVILYVRETNII